MPTISPSSTVLVTGANGYIGFHVIHELLLRGYSVHAAIRSADKVRVLADFVSKKHPEAKDRFTGFVVPDMTAEGAFDEAMKGVEGIIHTASPVSPAPEDPQAYIGPAVEGTTGILRSALRSGVKRVVITGSIAGTASSRDPAVAPARVYTEEGWNDAAVERVQREGNGAPGIVKYDASKTLGERAAWDFMDQHKSEACFDLCMINPAWVFGSVLDDTIRSPDTLPATPAYMYTMLFAAPPPAERVPKWINYVDVRDVAELYIRALEVEEAGSQRIIANSELVRWEDWLTAAEREGILPGLANVDLVKADLGHAVDNLPIPYFANQKAKRIFGIRFRTVPDTLKGVVDDFSARGWLKHLEA